MTKWSHLIEAVDDRLRRLEREYRRTNSEEAREAFLAEINRVDQDTYSWDNYTFPLFEDILKLLKGKKDMAVYGRSADKFIRKVSGTYRPNTKMPKARVVVHALRNEVELESATMSILRAGGFDKGDLDKFSLIQLKHHLFGRIQIDMEFGEMQRGYSRDPQVKRSWNCRGKVNATVWGPESDWSDYFGSANTPNSSWQSDIKRWKAKELLELLYSKMEQSCRFTAAVRRYGLTRDGNLAIPNTPEDE